MNIEKIINEMTLEEKVDFCVGKDEWFTKDYKNHGIPSLLMSDGPNGLRCQKGVDDYKAITAAIPSTCFPCSVTAANSWNKELIYKEGKAIATEAKALGVSVVLGPGVNIKRNPLAGRNFEYYSEDPYLAGTMAASFINGLQSENIGASLKHFACNNQEYKRMSGDSQVDEKTLHEIYLKPFEIAVKNSKPATVMCCYNKVNGIFGSDNKYLLTDVLRNDWGFDGLVVSDWSAINDRIKAFKAGCDLLMPGGSDYMKNAVISAVNEGKLSIDDINNSVRRLLNLIDKYPTEANYKCNYELNHHIAREIAEEGAVLLKNEDNILPLNTNDICLVGYMAEDLRYQGAGSSHINPIEMKQLTELLNVDYFPCVNEKGEATEESLTKVKEFVKKKRIAVVIAGLPPIYESEGFDRENMSLPKGHLEMIKAVSEANSNSVVVLLGGSCMEIGFIDSIKGLLYMGLSGQATAEAIINILTGKVNPSGKLAESWPISYDDVICKQDFNVYNPQYREGIYVGYRYYDKAKKAVRFPFGYGLSYSKFSYSNLSIHDRTISLSITNDSEVKGKEIVQLYVGLKNGIYSVVRGLKRFEKIELEPHQSKTVMFELDDDCFEVWDEGFKVQEGDYLIEVGPNSRDIRLTKEIHIQGHNLVNENLKDSWYKAPDGPCPKEDWEILMKHPVEENQLKKKGQYDMNSTPLEMSKDSLLMKLFCKIIYYVIKSSFNGDADMNNPDFKMMYYCALDCPMRGIVMNTNKAITDNMALGLVTIANGSFFKGLALILKK